MSVQPSPTQAPEPVPPQLQRVALHAVAAGLTPLIPVPFLDEYALRRVRERMVRALLRERDESAARRVHAAIDAACAEPWPTSGLREAPARLLNPCWRRLPCYLQGRMRHARHH